MKIKIDENGHPVLDETGNPIYIFDGVDGGEPEEKPVDVVSLFQKIKSLNGEAKTHRLEKQKLAIVVDHLKNAGIDPENVEDFVKEALDNREAVINFNDKDMKSVEDIEKIKKGVSDSYESKLSDLNKIIGDLKTTSENVLKQKDQSIRKLLIKGAFDKSDFIRDRTVLTPEIAFNTFGSYFQIEEDENSNTSAFAKDREGDTIYSMTNPGKVAEPEEAIELLIKRHPDSDSILRTSNGGDDSSGPKKKSGGITTDDLSKMSPTERLKHIHKQK